MTEQEIRDALEALIFGEPIENTLLESSSCRSFKDAGILTYNEGLVISNEDGTEFQVTIVQSR